MPNEAQKQRGQRKFSVQGVHGDKQRREIEEMLAYVEPPEPFSALIMLSPHKFDHAKRIFYVNKPSSPAFTHVQSGRTYMRNDALLRPPILEQYLSHEFGHLASGKDDEASAEQAAKPFRVFIKGFRNLQKNKQIINEGKLPLLRKDSGTGFNTLKPSSSL